MPIQLFPLNCVHANPWQTRIDEDDQHVADLAASIKEDGLLQVGVGRLHPGKPGHVQLALSHSRFAAYQLLNKRGVPGFGEYPVDIRELTDRKMSDYAAIENAKRKDLSAIEKARAIERRQKDFGLTQAEAAEPFGLTQGAVSHLMGLLKLPESIQRHVHTRALPERLARTMIKPAAIWPAEISKLADTIVKQREADKKKDKERNYEDEVERGIYDIACKGGLDLSQANFRLDWPEKAIPMSADIETAVGIPHGALKEIPNCNGCPFHIAIYNSNSCGQPKCYEAKAAYFIHTEMERVSKSKKIKVAAKGEKTTVIFDKDYAQTDFARAALATRHTSLRLVPLKSKSWNCNEVLGSYLVGLATTDQDGLKKAVSLAAKAKGKEPAKLASSQSADRYHERYQAQQRKREQEVRASRELVSAAAPHLASALPDYPALLEILFAKYKYAGDARKTEQEYKDTAKDPAARKQLIMRLVLLEGLNVSAYSGATPTKTRDRLADLARQLKLKLPTGWDKPPDAKLNGKSAKKKAGKR